MSETNKWDGVSILFWEDKLSQVSCTWWLWCTRGSNTSIRPSPPLSNLSLSYAFNKTMSAYPTTHSRYVSSYRNPSESLRRTLKWCRNQNIQSCLYWQIKVFTLDIYLYVAISLWSSWRFLFQQQSVSVEELSADSCLVEISFAGRKLVDLDWRKLDRMEILASENAKLRKKRVKG